MLQTGQLIIQRGNLNNGNLTGQTGSFTSGSLSGPSTYISVENDPVFRGSAAYTITQADIDRWNEEAEASAYYVTETQLQNQLVSYVTYNELHNELTSYVSYSYLYSYVGYALSDVDIDLDDYVTKDELSAQSYITSGDVSAMGYITSIPSEYITQEELSANGYLTSHQDLSGYVSKNELNNAGYISSIPSEYITEQELSECGYLTQHQSLAGLVNETDLNTILSTYATKNYVDDAILNAEIGGGSVTIDLSYYLRKDELNSVLVSYATKSDISNAGYVTNNTLENILLSYVKKSELANALSSYVSYAYLENKHYLTQHQDLSVYVSKDELSACGYLTQHQDLSAYATIAYVTGEDAKLNQKIDTFFNNIQSSLQQRPTYAYIESKHYLTEHQDLSAYATKAYVVDYVATHGGGGGTPIDLSSYVSKDELSACGYITMADVSACGYLTEHQSLAGYVTTQDLNTILNTYATKNYVDDAILNAEIGGGEITVDLSYYLRKDELSAVLVSYTTKDEISAQSYASKSYVMDAIAGIEPVSYQITYNQNSYSISIWQGTQAQYNQLPNYTSYQLYLIAQS